MQTYRTVWWTAPSTGILKIRNKNDFILFLAYHAPIAAPLAYAGKYIITPKKGIDDRFSHIPHLSVKQIYLSHI